MPRKFSQVSYDLAGSEDEDEEAKREKSKSIKEASRRKLEEINQQQEAGYKTRRSMRQKENLEEQIKSAEAIEERMR